MVLALVAENNAVKEEAKPHAFSSTASYEGN
jgi:hypothetical protein